METIEVSTVEQYIEGYQDGFEAGADIGAARVLMGLRQVLGDDLLDAMLMARLLPHIAEYGSYRLRTTYSALPDRPEYLGGPVSWEVPA